MARHLVAEPFVHRRFDSPAYDSRTTSPWVLGRLVWLGGVGPLTELATSLLLMDSSLNRSDHYHRASPAFLIGDSPCTKLDVLHTSLKATLLSSASCGTSSCRA